MSKLSHLMHLELTTPLPLRNHQLHLQSQVGMVWRQHTVCVENKPSPTGWTPTSRAHSRCAVRTHHGSAPCVLGQTGQHQSRLASLQGQMQVQDRHWHTQLGPSHVPRKSLRGRMGGQDRFKGTLASRTGALWTLTMSLDVESRGSKVHLRNDFNYKFSLASFVTPLNFLIRTLLFPIIQFIRPTVHWFSCIPRTVLVYD